ncbi:uncharacterized protein BXZ73DRAFT_104558 [Epithele typhae]|uniref:uncharacterized protein n=1 Tax=Epithele typhae TaxID=378194 RepID=UPI0020072219|nr:uncharacterized protein BXZ73DRAFT_104558 [Epithele typhae]KAH9920824.1 hypothetical protein BXZ73DRAFT_104558 [Epithele typhae]
MSSYQYEQPMDHGNVSDGERDGGKPKVPRRTPMACQFCRGRKLKCDGRPTCANCQRRTIPCVYVPVYVPPVPRLRPRLSRSFVLRPGSTPQK